MGNSSWQQLPKVMISASMVEVAVLQKHSNDTRIIECLLWGHSIFVLHERFAFSRSSLCIGLIHIKSECFNDPLDETLLSHVDVAGGFVTMELNSQETSSIAFLFELYFFGTETFPEFIDVFFFGAPEQQIINIYNANVKCYS